MRLAFLFCFVVQVTFMHARLPDLIPYRKGNLWGYADSTRKIVIEPVYDNVEFFVCGRAVVKKNGKYGVIDTAGRYVLPVQYKVLEAIPTGGYWIGTMIGNKAGVIDSNAQFVIPPVYTYLVWCGGKYVAAQTDSTFIIKGLETQTETVIPRIAGDAWPLYVPGFNAFIVQMKTGYGVIDLSGKQRIPAKYDYIVFHDCGFFECIQNSRTTWFGKGFKRKRQSAVPRDCSLRVDFFYQPAFILMPDAQRKVWGWQRRDSSWVTMPLYDSVSYFNSGLALFIKDAKAGMVDTSFKEVIPARYEHLLTVSPWFAMAMRRPSVTFAREPDTRLFLGYVDIHGTEYWE